MIKRGADSTSESCNFAPGTLSSTVLIEMLTVCWIKSGGLGLNHPILQK
jgi:hypothetical protein